MRPVLAGWADNAARTAGTSSRMGRLLTGAAYRLAPGVAFAGTISGTVFRDQNANGTQDPAQVGPPARVAELGVAGVTVTAYNASGTAVGTVTSGANGAYSLTTSDAGTGPYRVEFTGLPTSLLSGPAGAGSGTTVQFVNATPAANVNLGINDPLEYCQVNPLLATPAYVSGDALGGGTAGSAEVLVTFPYNAGSTQVTDGTTVPPGGNSPLPKKLAVASQIGATWGEAYQRSSRTLYTASVTRRHAGYGPLGIGGIYAISNLNNATPTVTPFIDLATIGVNVGSLTNGQRNLPASSTVSNADAAAFDAVGKVGIGDLDISEDSKTLWFINLNDRKLYSLFINDPPVTPTAANVSSFTIPTSECSNGDFRPWATKVYRGRVYVGGVCANQTSQVRTDLKAIVYEFNPVGGSFTKRLDFPLTYNKGITWAYNDPADPVKPALDPVRNQWNAWTSDFSKFVVQPTLIAPARRYLIYPQPILADLEFDNDGSLIIGFLDRTAMQSGYLQADPTGNANPPCEGMSSGDLLRAFNNNGTFVLESNGSVGGNTGGSNNGQGPGGGEFYFQEDFTLNGQRIHQENTLGGLSLVPGSTQIATVVFDPFTIRSGGVFWMNNTTGRTDRRYEVFPAPADPNLPNGTFGKSAGLGDLEILCDAAPIEIGNRLWFDFDRDGVQDPNEAGIPNATVQLFRNGQSVGTTTTNSAGNYYFNDSNVPGGIQPNTAYEIRVNKAQLALASTVLTVNDANSGANSDLRDSDAAMVGNVAVIPVTTGTAGDNNHTYDFGFQPQRVDLSLTKAVSNGPYVPGQQITYTLIVANATDCGIFGPCSAATDVSIRDVLPAELNFVTANPAADFNNAASTWTVGTLNPGASRSITITATIKSGVVGNIRNYAQVQTQGGFADIDSTPGNGNPNNPPAEDDEADVTINVPEQRVDLSLLKSVASGTYAPGQPLTYTLTVTNAVSCGNFGPCANATDVTIRDVLPSQLTFVSASPAGAFNAATNTWTVGNLNAGATAALTITANVNAGVVGNIVNYAQVQTQSGPRDIDSTPGNGTSPTPIEDDEAAVTINISAVSIGDFVWIDKNGNGCQDAGEAGLPGVTVTLLRGDGTTAGTQTTSATGGYLFENLPPGTYRVQFGTASGYTFTRRNAGPCGTEKDSDADPATGLTSTVTLNPGQSNLDLDAGFYQPASLGDTVFLDANRNGILNAGEVGIGGVTVVLLDANGQSIATTTTDANGKYSFTNLVPGNYSIMLSGLPAGFVYTLRDQGGDDTLDSDVDPATGKTAQVMLMSGQNYPDLDAGAYPRIDLSLTKTVSPAGPYINNQAITYTLTVTNAAGLAQATGVTVRDVLPAGVSFTSATASQGSFDNASGTWTVGSLASGASATLQIAAKITTSSGTVANCAQVQTANEFDVDSTPGNGTFTGALEDDEACASLNVVSGMIGDFVWIDQNGNGCQDAGEPGLAGVTVTLFRGDGTQVGQPVTTDATGRYMFSDLAPGNYYVVFGQPNGYAYTGQKRCNNDVTDSDVDSTGRTATISLGENGKNLDLDAGLVQAACIRGFVYVDANDNGIKEASEAGIPGVTITLTGTDALNAPVSRSTTTGADGAYEFCGLTPGTYKLTETQPANYIDGKDTAGSLGGTVTNDMISNIVLTSGANSINNNFGELQTYDLSLTKNHIGNFQSGAASETYTLRVTNLGPGSAQGPFTVTDDLPPGMTYLSGSGTNWSCVGGAGSSSVTCTYNGNLAPNAYTELNIRVRLSNNIQCTVINVARLTATGDTNTSNNIARDTTKIDGCTPAPAQQPGINELPGSLLIFPVYTSDPTNPNRENTKICLTNTDSLQPAFVHLFFVDGTSCAVADSFICLTQNQTACFSASDVDPGTMGYVVAVATDMNGCPVQNNKLIGDEYVKFSSGHFGNLTAESYKALQPITTCSASSVDAVINLNGVQYDRPARTLAASSILSRADGNISLLTVIRTGGNLFTSAGTIGTLFGLLYDDQESAYSFNMSGSSCQIKRTLSDTDPRTAPRFTTVIPAGRSGWMKIYSGFDVGIAGAIFNFNSNATSSTGAFTGGRGLHKLTLGQDAYTIPVFPPTC